MDFVYFHFADVERVDLIEPPEHLRAWCRLQSARLMALRNPPEVIKEVVKVVQIDETLPERLTRLYSHRTLKEMRDMIALARAEYRRTGNAQLEGFAQGVVWASGVD